MGFPTVTTPAVVTPETVIATVTPPALVRPQHSDIVPPAIDPDLRFSTADIERARQQEKDKVYGRVDDLQSRLAVFEQEREERLATQTAANSAAAEAEAARAREEQTLKETVRESQSHFEAQLAEERAARLLLEATLVKERDYNILQAYKVNAINAAQDDILPELLDYVTGTTPEEIDSSIAGLTQRSESILENTGAALQQQRSSAPGPRVTAPPLGPFENQTATTTLTAADIANMPMDEYATYRSQLGVTGGQGNHGLFSR